MEDIEKPKFTYLLGAGASADTNALPVLKGENGLNRRLLQLSDNLKNIFPEKRR